jgi:cytochrome c
MKFGRKFLLLAAVAPLLLSGAALAGDRGTKPEAIAMVKKAAEFIKTNGADKAYAAFTDKANTMFHDRDLYVVTYDLTGKCLAHGSNPKLVGKDLMDAQDADGTYYVKQRMELAKTSPSFWQDYKFADPLTKMIHPKSTYCQKVNETAVCVGIYKE